MMIIKLNIGMTGVAYGVCELAVASVCGTCTAFSVFILLGVNDSSFIYKALISITSEIL